MGKKLFLQLKIELLLGRRVLNTFHCIVEDCRPVWHLHELALLKDVHQAGLAHRSVPDDDQLPALCFGHDDDVLARSAGWDRVSEFPRAVLSTRVIVSQRKDDMLRDMQLTLKL